MATKKKLLQAAAGSAGGGAGLNVEEVFSTYLWDGTGGFGERTIANGIDLSGEGGFVWVKDRENSQSHGWYDTERGATKYLQSNTTDAEATVSLGVTSFKTNGFGVDYSHNNAEYASWTFRKAPKFFDVVTWTGDGTAGRTISHNLNSSVGTIFVKRTDGLDEWKTLHRNDGSQWKTGVLNSTTSFDNATAHLFGNGSSFVAPTSTEFTVTGNLNGNTDTFVAYLFAHNDGDGDFGPDADQDVIKCGSYTGNDGEQTIDLGFEAQWVMIKNATNTSNWAIFDVMRDFTNSTSVSGPDSKVLYPNLSNAETGVARIFPTANGFGFVAEAGGTVNAISNTYVYVAIRRPMAVPTDATKVFNVHDQVNEPSTSPLYLGNTDVIDMVMSRNRYKAGGFNLLSDRLRGSTKVLYTNNDSAESTGITYIEYDHNTNNYIPAGGYGNNSGGTSEDSVFWQWKRAPNFFDVVAYTGNGTLGRTVSHNLGVAPEMMWIKVRSEAEAWRVYHSGLPTPEDDFLKLNTTEAAGTTIEQWNSTAPTATEFSVSGQGRSTNDNGEHYIAYLFASLDGVSKVGSFTGNGTTINVECGFSSGARFVMTKRTDVGSDWVVWDTARGIVAGNDGYLVLNDVNEESSSYDSIDPYSSGFSLNYDGVATNILGASYIFYAIA